MIEATKLQMPLRIQQVEVRAANVEEPTMPMHKKTVEPGAGVRAAVEILLRGRMSLALADMSMAHTKGSLPTGSI